MGESVRKIIFDIAVVAFIITGGSVVGSVASGWVVDSVFGCVVGIVVSVAAGSVRTM